MTPEELEEIYRIARGFSKARWEYREDIPGRGWGAIVNVADFAETDDPFVIDDTLDEHVAEPLAGMLNAVGPLVAEVRRLRAEVASLRTELALSRREP